MSSDELPIAAIATAVGPAALAVIRVSGSGCVRLLSSRFSRPDALRSAAGHTLHHGAVHDGENRVVDEVLVAVYRAPASYTGEESAEVFCHGSPAGVRRVFGALLSAGFAAAAPGEFTRRAFINGKLDLTRAEAVNEIVGAQTTDAHALAMDRLSGSVERAIEEIRAQLVGIMAQIAIQLDYPEEETGPVDADRMGLKEAGDRCRSIASTCERGRLYQHGARVAIAGRTNAGKSSLFNRLLRQDRSIVSETHGTTRDYVEALIDVCGVPVRLFDTAGLRESSEAIEQEGMRRSSTVVASADLVLYVVDAYEGPTREDAERLEQIPRHTPTLRVLNKVDLGGDPSRHRSAASELSAIPVSALTGAGIDHLNDAILSTLLDEKAGSGGGPTPATVIIDSERQRDLLLRAADAADRAVESLSASLPADVVAVDLQEALEAVGEITGEISSAEILDEMFRGFCVGK